MLSDLGILIGRIMLSLLFLTSGWPKLTGFSQTVDQMAMLGMPSATGAAVAVVIAELGGAVCVMLGLYTRLAAAGLAVFTLLATYFVHLYWTYPPDAQMAQSIQFWKNIAITGGFIILAGVGGGRFALSRRLR